MLKTKKHGVNSFKAMPWKNGKGSTLELAKDAHTPYLWRLSAATLNGSSEFSHYPEYDRHFVLLEGNEIKLVHGNGKMRRLLSYTPYRFSGDLTTQCEFEGLGLDFNLLVLKDKAKGAIYPTYFKTSAEMHFPLSGNEHFLYCTEGEIAITERNLGEEHIVKKGELFQITRSSDKEFVNLKALGTATTIALWVILHLEK